MQKTDLKSELVTIIIFPRFDHLLPRYPSTGVPLFFFSSLGVTHYFRLELMWSYLLTLEYMCFIKTRAYNTK